MQNTLTKHLVLIGLAFNLNSHAYAYAEKAPLIAVGSTPAIAESEKTAEKVQLKFVPRVGDERVLRLNVVQQGTQIGGKRKSIMRQVVGVDTAYRVLSIEKDGRVRVRATTQSTRFLREVDGKVITRFDSAKAARPVGDAAEILALLNGMTFVLQLNPNGTIHQIEGKDKIVEQMLDKMKVPKTDREFLRPLMLSSLQGSAFKNLGNTFASFAAEEVSVGDSWPKTDVVTMESNLIYDGKLLLAKRAAGISTLHLKSAITPDPNRKAGAEVLPMRGTQSGYYVVDEKTGWTQRAHLEQRWNARVNEMGVPIAENVKNARRLYVKMTFDIGTLKAK